MMNLVLFNQELAEQNESLRKEIEEVKLTISDTDRRQNQISFDPGIRIRR